MLSITDFCVPKEWESENDYDSHRPALYLALLNTGNKVWELGCGFGSTELLYNYCKQNDKWFSSVDTNKEWADKFPKYTHYIESYDGILNNINDNSKKECSLLFVDLAPAEKRKDLIKEYANHAEVIVVHDSENGAEYVYGMKEVLSTFKHRLDYRPKGKPHTTIVSNFLNVALWV